MSDLDYREMSTVLAALRYWQAYGMRAPLYGRVAEIHEIADSGGEIEMLSEEEIDDLCERINVGLDDKEPPDPPGWEGGFAENH